jgi:hypothetical protein
MTKAESDQLIFVNMIKITKEGVQSWIAEMCDKFLELSYPQKRELLAFFVSLEVGGEKWEKYYKEEGDWLKLWVNIVTFYTGREDIKSEPDKNEFIEQFKEYFGTSGYRNAKAENEIDKKETEAFEGLMEEL